MASYADTTTTLAPAAAFTSGPLVITASAALFEATDVGRAIALYQQAPDRIAATAYTAGYMFAAVYAGVSRLYRVIKDGSSAAASMAGTTPDYDLHAPHETGTAIEDGTATLRYLGSGKHVWGFGVITAVADSTHATVNVSPRAPFAATDATLRWKLGGFSDALGWPSTGAFHSQRLWVAAADAGPQTLYASNTADFETFSAYDPDGTVLDTHSITIALDDDRLNLIYGLSSFARGMAVMASSGEFVVSPANANGALSPSNIRALRQGDRGSQADVAHQRVSGVVLFVQRGGRKVRELQYDFGTDSFTAVDLTQLADHITAGGIVQTAFQEVPEARLWAVRADGVLLCLSYDREQKVRAWTRHIIGGTDTRVESVCVVPTPDGTAEDVYVQVARTVGGATVRHIEYIRPEFRSEATAAADAFHVDAGLTYVGAPTGAVAGLWHLEGELVQVVADGSARQAQTVTDGRVPITGLAASTVHVGLPYLTKIVPMVQQMEAGARGGTAQGRPQRIHQVVFRLLASAGGQFGSGPRREPLVVRDRTSLTGTAVPLFTGDLRTVWTGGWDTAADIVVETTDPLPLTLLGIVLELQTNG